MRTTPRANVTCDTIMKYCPTSVVRNQASIQNLITRFCCGSLSTRSLYFCNKNFSVQESRSKVWVFSSTNLLIVLTQQVSPFLHGKLCILFFLRKTCAHSDKESTRKNSHRGRRQTLKLTTSSNSILLHCCSKRDVNMVSSVTLPMDDGRAGSIVLTFETLICWKKGKQKQERPSKPHRALSLWWSNHLNLRSGWQASYSSRKSETAP